MNIKDLNKKKVPIVKIDKKMNDYSGKVLFPEKLEKANEKLRRIGLPKTTGPERKQMGSNHRQSEKYPQ